MSNQPIDDAELLRIIQNERARLEHISEAERQALIEQRVRELLAEERAEERLENEQEAEIRSAELAYDPARERDRARETAKSAALLLIMLLLILLLIAAATGRTDILPIAGVQATPTLWPRIIPDTSSIKGQSVLGSVPTFAPGVTPEVDQTFNSYYYKLKGRGQECSIGDPITPGYTLDGLRYQWFERAVLKEMPEGFVDDPSIDDLPWSIQGEPLGREVTTGMPFPTTLPLLSQPGEHNFGETGYTVRGEFLDFWVKCYGLHVLGYPISDPVYEVLKPDQQQQSYLVQYFERGRLEYHPDNPNRRVQFGLLGWIKAKNKDFKPSITMPPYPNAPPSATPIPAPFLAATATRPPAATALPLPTSAATAVPAAPSYPSP